MTPKCPDCKRDQDDCICASLASAPKALLEAVAEVVWYDPQLSHSPEKPGKIIDGSIAFMESAEIGTKLFAAPVSSVSEDQKDAERYRTIKNGNFSVERFVSSSYGWKLVPTEELDSTIDAAMQEDKP